MNQLLTVRFKTYWPVVLLAVLTCDFGKSIAVAAVTAKSKGPLPFHHVEASSSTSDFPAAGAADGDRFSTQSGKLWKAAPSVGPWYWQADFGELVEIGAILQVLGDNDTLLTSAPLAYVWQMSEDGKLWRDLEPTRMAAERRMYRIHRLPGAVLARYLRLAISSTSGPPPAVREIEVYSRPNQMIEFPDWVMSVSSEDAPITDTCHRYLDLARKCDGWSALTAQYLWHGDFDPQFVSAEPRPMCVFFSGSHPDWCEVNRATWEGTQRVLDDGSVAMWAACGGAQAFGILSDTGVEKPWDCPKCRDPNHPKSPIYGHIGLIDATKKTKCGIYTNNIYEIGPTPLRLVREDPAFKGLPDEFLLPEYHCGQLEYLPAGWDLIVTKGKGGKTWMQCMKKRGTCIYAAQFHIELRGTPEVSRQVMSNFLATAKAWSQEHGGKRYAGETAHAPATNTAVKPVAADVEAASE